MTDHSDLLKRLNAGVVYSSIRNGVKTFHIKDADATMKAAAEVITAQQAAIIRQAGAARTIQATTAMIAQNENERLRKIDRSEYNAAATVDSERDANARLTDELDAALARAEKAEAERDQLFDLAKYLDDWTTKHLGGINADIEDAERSALADDMARDWFGAGIGASVRDQLAAYLGAGLSLGLIMAQVLPLSVIGVGVYTATWPQHVYCARPAANCFGLIEIYPMWLGKLMFDLDRPIRTFDKEPTP